MTFAQFRLYMVLRWCNPWRSATKFSGHSSIATILCKFTSSHCNFKIHFLVDSLYQLILVKFTGSHAAACYKKNINHYYPAYRNLFIAKAPERVHESNNFLMELRVVMKVLFHHWEFTLKQMDCGIGEKLTIC